MEIRTRVICEAHHYTKKWTAAEMSFLIRYKDLQKKVNHPHV